MPCPHNEISIVQRRQQQAAVAAAAYQSGEKLFCEYDQQVKHYPEKRGIVHNEILLPAKAIATIVPLFTPSAKVAHVMPWKILWNRVIFGGSEST